MIKIFFNLIIVSTFTLFFISCSENNDTVSANIEELDPEFNIVDKKKVTLNYRNHCGGCHGQNFASFVEREWKYGNSLKELLNSIKIGYKNNGMPAYGGAFTEQEVNDLANYILLEIKGKTKKMLETSNLGLSELIKSDDLNFRLETITDKIPGTPWGIEQLPNGEILVTELGG